MNIISNASSVMSFVIVSLIGKPLAKAITRNLEEYSGGCLKAMKED